jgi:hypothetical protein
MLSDLGKCPLPCCGFLVDIRTEAIASNTGRPPWDDLLGTISAEVSLKRKAPAEVDPNPVVK